MRRSRSPSGRSAYSRPRVMLGVLAFASLVLAGCSQRSSTTGVAFAVNQPDVEGQAVAIPGSVGWVDTGIDVSEGEPVSVTASGRVIVRQSDKWGQKFEASVGPAGTFLVHDGIQDQKFPLPSGSHGPAPCFCLMGRIGEGPAFFVGQSRSWTATASGRLQLAVNDFDPSDSEGAFHSQVTLPKQLQPVAYEEVVPAQAENGRPFSLSQVVVFYVDGLRPDVVREMAAMGHLPNIKTLFLDNGVWLSNCFTGFPSDTITSNGTMWTGCFSDRHGLKGQVRFSRHRLVSESYLDPLGPSRSARMLAPQGVDRALIDGQSTIQRWVQGNDAGEIWRQSLTSDIAPLYEILRREGHDWATGMLPVMTEMPPPLWSRSLARSVPYFHAQEAWRYIDDANTNYTVRQLIPRDQPVMIVWLPETDSVSHKECRGQFGATRRTIAKADQLIGQVIAEFRAHDRLRTTYFCLVSDHGHHGGRTGHLSLFDVAHEVLYRPREISTDGHWIGGGLGLSVRQHREWARHAGDSGRQFVFVDGDSDGAARLYFPKGHYRSGDWSGPSRPSDLLAYRIADHLPPINLVDMLSRAEFRNPDGQQQEQLLTQAANPPGAPRNFPPSGSRDARPTPIDLVLMKLTDQSLLIATADRGCAVIERRAATRPSAGAIRWQLRYSVVSNVEPTADGNVAYHVVERPLLDPLKLTQLADQDFLRDFHDEGEWLEAQTNSEYPDTVVAFARHMLWQENLQLQESDAAPDLVITAKSGWYFGNSSSAGTTHGHPLADAMRASWFVSGPNIRRGARIDAPCRLVDLTPTILDMIGSRANRDHFDGRAIRTIYQPETPQAPAALVAQQQTHDEKLPFARGPYSRQTLRTPHPPGIARLNPNGDVTLTSGQVMKAIYWDSVDLQAWRPVSYQPVLEYPHQPLTINHPASPFDLNNITYNALLFTELSVFRILDDAISPVSRGRRPIMSAADQVDLALRHSQNEWISESANVFDLTNVNLSDYQFASQTNLRRMDAAVDYVQRREQSLEEEIANATGQHRLPGSKFVHGTIDMTQYGFWSVYGFGQRLLMQVLDETLIQGIENTTDRTLNAARPMPAEVVVPAGGR